MPFEKGDFTLIDYVGRIVETAEVFETTIEEVARKEGMYREGSIYEPRLVVIGEGWVLKALEESLLNLELDKVATVEIPPEKAFGNRDPEKVKLYALRRLTAQGIAPRVGMRVEVDRRLATVRTMGSGRVQLDFNPPLAGRTLTYEVTVRKKLETDVEKIQALIHRRVPLVDINKFDLTIDHGILTVGIPEEGFYIEGLQLSKRGISMDVQKFFTEIATVKFIEIFKRPESAAEQPSPKETHEGT